ALKRYLNTYRMLKAEVSDRGDLEVVRFLLAVAIGRAGDGTELLGALASRPDATLGELADALRAAGRTALTDRLAQLPDPGRRGGAAARGRRVPRRHRARGRGLRDPGYLPALRCVRDEHAAVGRDGPGRRHGRPAVPAGTVRAGARGGRRRRGGRGVGRRGARR